MKRITAFFIFFYSSLPVALGQPSSYWQQQVNYKIDVTLNNADKTLDGYVIMDYINNSPDTLPFIWIHLWPNAFKNDKTAFTDQTLENGSTEFYFSDAEKRGYINRLAFKVNGETVKTEDHPQHQDIIKLVLPEPLLPGKRIKTETPFHVKIPYNFSRGGYDDGAFQITQWYPKAAVYDKKGWHPMPYLDQGEFYNDFGNYEVQITLPLVYKLAATGELQNEKSAASNKTTHIYKQDNVTDFAWFADKSYVIKNDTLQLPSGRIIKVAAFYYGDNQTEWKDCINMIKRAVLTKSRWLGEYPYNTVTIVDGGQGGGMEYPTITLLESGGSEMMLDFVINHEVGHNWFQGILATNERLHPWMDEGMNTYYDNRYSNRYYPAKGIDMIQAKSAFLKNRMSDDFTKMLLQTATALKKDQPIETPSSIFSPLNYNVIAYTKTGQWMRLLEKQLGQPLFDSCMKTYFSKWQFKHPYPADFKSVMEQVSGRNLDSTFSLLNTKGAIKEQEQQKTLRLKAFFSLKDTDKYNYIFAAPAVGYNFYDKLMVGVLLHNYTLPLPKLKFVLAPLYATKSKQFNGLGRVGYTFQPGNNGQRLEFAVAGWSFSGNNFADSTNIIHNQRFTKIVPAVKFVFANKKPRSQIIKFLQWKTFLINEQAVQFSRDTVNQIDIITYPTESRYLNQLRFVFENYRALYPYNANLQIDQGEDFVRAGLTANYFFNYAKEGGLNVRIFAGKFFYLGDKTFLKQFQTDQYQLNMTGPKGYEDYTFSNYFAGRNEFDKFRSQQIMIRDGAFKVRTDLLSSKIGKTDDWLAAANFTTTIPRNVNPLSVLPFKLPVRVFLDIGTYADAWKKNATTSRFIYDAGLQLSLLNNVVNIYFPILYSKVYSNYFKSTIPENRFIKNIAFSIDLQNINLRKMIPQIPF